MIRKVQIATPTHDGRMAFGYLTSFVDTMHAAFDAGVPIGLSVAAHSSLLPTTRSELAGKFLQDPDAGDALLFIDSDIGWNAADVFKLAAYDEGIVAGAGRGRRDGRFCFRLPKGVDPMDVQRDKRGLVLVQEVGCGFMMIARRTLEEMHAAYPELHGRTHPSAPVVAGLFLPLVRDGELLSEDYSFCRRWRELNGPVWLDPDVSLRHYGATKTWEGAPASLFA